MNIYLIKDGQNAGPYSESEVMARVKDGRYSKTDLAWCEGFTSAMPLIEILCGTATSQPLPACEAFSVDELRLIAKNFRNLLAVAACWFVFCFMPMPDSLERICFLAITGAWIRFGWRLASGLRQKPWTWVLLSLIPLVNLYALVRILRAAAKTLKDNGIPVGFMGADPVALAQLVQQESIQPRA